VACGVITCPDDTTCADYQTSISANRCKQLGQCKTAADCTFLPALARTICGIVQPELYSDITSFCDGAGNCRGPVVKCGGDGDCQFFDQACCGTSGSGLICQVNACEDFGINFGPYLCDEKSDCRAGYVCCLSSNPGGRGSICVSHACVSDGPSTNMQVCNPAATPSECATGTCQADPFAPSGWFVCK
jgi:hypothetical protein